jgi:precorrin-3B synthase
VIASPLPNDPASLIDADALARDLRRVIAERNLTLAPKVSVIVDGGGALELDAVTADIRLRAVNSAAKPMVHVALAGDAASATPLGLAAQDEVADIASDLLAMIAAFGSEARAADLLRAKGIGAIRAALPTRIDHATHLPTRPCAEPISLHRLTNGAYALGLALAFGHTQADALVELASIAQANGATWIRPAPDRALLIGPLSEAKAVAMRKAAGRLGFIIDARDQRRRIVACPGAPSCASGLIGARAIAAELAQCLPATLEAVHVSGCAKGCAHPARVPLTIVGTEHGCGIVRDGTTRDLPETYVGANDLPAALASLTKTREAAHA